MDPDVSNIVGTLNVAANVVVIVILPLVIFLVKHMSGIRKEVHDRITAVEREHQSFREYVAKEFLSEVSAMRLIDGNREVLETRLTSMTESLARIERWLGKVSDREMDRRSHEHG